MARQPARADLRLQASQRASVGAGGPECACPAAAAGRLRLANRRVGLASLSKKNVWFINAGYESSRHVSAISAHAETTCYPPPGTAMAQMFSNAGLSWRAPYKRQGTFDKEMSSFCEGDLAVTTKGSWWGEGTF